MAKPNELPGSSIVSTLLTNFPLLQAAHAVANMVYGQTVGTTRQLEALRESAENPEDKAVISAIEEKIAEVAFVLVDGTEQDLTVSAEQRKQNHKESMPDFNFQPDFSLVGEGQDQTTSVAQKKTDREQNIANRLEKQFVLVGKVRDHVDQLQINTSNIMAKAQIRWNNKTLMEKVESLVSKFVSSVQSVINSFTKQINNTFGDPKAKHGKNFKPVLGELMDKSQDKSQHKEKFKPTLNELKTNIEGTQRASVVNNSTKSPAPKGTSTTKKYKGVMEDINKAGSNEEGTSSNLRGIGRKK